MAVQTFRGQPFFLALYCLKIFFYQIDFLFDQTAFFFQGFNFSFHFLNNTTTFFRRLTQETDIVFVHSNFAF